MEHENSGQQDNSSLIFTLRLWLEKTLIWFEAFKQEFEGRYLNTGDADALDVEVVKEGLQETIDLFKGDIVLIDTLDVDSSGDYFFLILQNIANSQERDEKFTEIFNNIYNSLKNLGAYEFIFKLMSPG